MRKKECLIFITKMKEATIESPNLASPYLSRISRPYPYVFLQSSLGYLLVTQVFFTAQQETLSLLFRK